MYFLCSPIHPIAFSLKYVSIVHGVSLLYWDPLMLIPHIEEEVFCIIGHHGHYKFEPSFKRYFFKRYFSKVVYNGRWQNLHWMDKNCLEQSVCLDSFHLVKIRGSSFDRTVLPIWSDKISMPVHFHWASKFYYKWSFCLFYLRLSY